MGDTQTFYGIMNINKDKEMQEEINNLESHARAVLDSLESIKTNVPVTVVQADWEAIKTALIAQGWTPPTATAAAVAEAVVVQETTSDTHATGEGNTPEATDPATDNTTPVA